MSEAPKAPCEDPSPRAVLFGRIVFWVIGSILVVVPLAFSVASPMRHVILAGGLMSLGVFMVILGFALPPKLAANIGFLLPFGLP